MIHDGTQATTTVPSREGVKPHTVKHDIDRKRTLSIKRDMTELEATSSRKDEPATITDTGRDESGNETPAPYRKEADNNGRSKEVSTTNVRNLRLAKDGKRHGDLLE
ncbi:hypothetical protein K435DRAFT_881387 [Dendrothele bispora CBS 962.96]|uniref:Uncharacterized protein n=1 Tax=Dendrothele bispora (strain CBS 962.96) TaxID=1314807 RepID=A0A4S8KIQ2_DENBC|nr:hypothetical protein K435DRAFT_881387 [Dendrothele bispora CBS 962.96]